eukprot:GHVT01099629.1.p1 GENE.GHVT01099629.1~~GHVT01099629.1.p1  ORF type:complete len:325 (+),score=99.54 GHVT01099629.1:656-1630(+)
MAKGRYREFYQCDFDIAGAYEAMLPDAEVIAVLVELLTKLQHVTGDFVVRLNSRKLLDLFLVAAGVPADKFKPMCSAIDKLDKMSWEAVKHEMVHTKGVAPEMAENVKQLIDIKGSAEEILSALETNELLLKAEAKKSAQTAEKSDATATAKKQGDKKGARTAGGGSDVGGGPVLLSEVVAELRLLLGYLKSFGVAHRVVLDVSLARGLDYYTGVIYEATLVGEAVGSVGGGGRYDGLVGQFSGRDIPAVGVSLGIERVFRIVEKKLALAVQQGADKEKVGAALADAAAAAAKETQKNERDSQIAGKDNHTDVLVCSMGEQLIQ